MIKKYGEFIGESKLDKEITNQQLEHIVNEIRDSFQLIVEDGLNKYTIR